MRSFLRPFPITMAVASLASCGVDLVPTGEDEREPALEPAVITQTADIVSTGAPVENDFATCEWFTIETFPERVVGHCSWKSGCSDGAAIPLPDIAPAVTSVVAKSADETMSGLTYDPVRQELVLPPDACPADGASIEVLYTDAVQAQMADRPKFVYGDGAYGCGLAEVQMRSALPLETGAEAETLTVRVDLAALGIDYPTEGSLAQDVVSALEVSDLGPVQAVVERLRVGTPDRLFSSFCADEQGDDAILTSTWIAVSGRARITVHKEFIAPDRFYITADLADVVFRLQGQETLSKTVDILMSEVPVGPR